MQSKRVIGVRSCLRTNPAIPLTTAEIDGPVSNFCSTNATTLRTYRLQYETQANEAQQVGTNFVTPGFYGSGRARVESIRECSDSAYANCRPATKVNWSNARNGYQSAAEAWGSGNANIFNRAVSLRFPDLNRDGLPDVVWRQVLDQPVGGDEADKIWFALQKPNVLNQQRFTAPVHVLTLSRAIDDTEETDRLWSLIDMNADGVEDIIVTRGVPGGFARFVHYAKADGSGYPSVANCQSNATFCPVRLSGVEHTRRF